MKPRIVYVHGNMASTGWHFGWSPWLKAELEKLGYPVVFETMPDSIIARKEYWLPFLHDTLKVGENDVIVGWSSGGTAAMRYAELYKIKGSVLISPTYTDINDELVRQSGYFDEPWQWEKIKANQEKIHLFYSDDDPFVPQSEFQGISAGLGIEPTCVPSRGHFMESPFPELLEYIKDTY